MLVVWLSCCQFRAYGGKSWHVPPWALDRIGLWENEHGRDKSRLETFGTEAHSVMWAFTCSLKWYSPGTTYIPSKQISVALWKFLSYGRLGRPHTFGLQQCMFCWSNQPKGLGGLLTTILVKKKKSPNGSLSFISGLTLSICSVMSFGSMSNGIVCLKGNPNLGMKGNGTFCDKLLFA